MEEYCTGNYKTQGVHMYPETSFRPAYKDRWSRECKICGKKEYTYTKKAVKYEPSFE